MNKLDINIKPKRWHMLIMLFVSLAFILFSIDMHFTHIIPNVTKEAQQSWVLFLLILGVGLLGAKNSIRSFINPEIWFAADSSGFTISRQGSSVYFGESEKNIKCGDKVFVPWEKVVNVSVNEFAYTTMGEDSTCRNTQYIPAIKISCDRSVNFKLCSAEPWIHATTGHNPNDITNEDREHFSPEELDDLLHSIVYISKSYLPKASLATNHERIIALKQSCYLTTTYGANKPDAGDGK